MQDFFIFLSNHLTLTYALAGGFLLLAMVELLRLKQMTFRIDTKQAVQLINREHAVVIDLRSPEQYKKSHILNAEILSVDDLSTSPQKLAKWKTKPIIFVCQQGLSSQKVAGNLVKKGYQAFSLAGGFNAWKSAGLPLTTKG